MNRTYSELITIPIFEQRFEYCKLNGQVGYATFGFDRWMTQSFYKSAAWKRLRNDIIIRDNGCDLADPDHPIRGQVFIHHLNPITKKDIINETDYLLNPDYLVCVSKRTHDAIHYSDANILQKDYVARTPGDTCPWKSHQ